MSHTPRLPRTSVVAIALVAILGITTGWNVPPIRSGDLAAPPDHPALTSEHLTTRAAERAIAWAAAWDARDAAFGSTTPPRHATPGKRPVAVAPVEGERFVPALQSAPVAKAKSRASDATPAAKARVYEGRNHFWFPALGISRNVVLFPCERKRPPDNYLYRWGCAGRNNVYLLGHAYSVMKPLHDAFVRGQLRVGMIAIYADANGRVRKYRITEWRVVDPAAGVRWAIASQPVPSMTLQTCVGETSQWRLNVRLVAVN